jgi:MFS family permease
MIVASIPIGKAIDKIGRKIPLVLGIITFDIGLAIFTIGNLLTATIAVILFGIGQLLFMAATTALSTDLVDQKNRGKVNGLINFLSYIVMGFGMLAGNFLYVTFFPQLPFYMDIALSVPLYAIVIFLVHEPRREDVTTH